MEEMCLPPGGDSEVTDESPSRSTLSNSVG